MPPGTAPGKRERRTVADLFFDQEFRTLIPPLTPEERQGLKESLEREGNRDAVVIWKQTGLLLDGHNRYDLCHELGITLKPPVELWLPDRDAAKAWIIRNQLGRRNLSPYVRSVLALKLEEVYRAKAKGNQRLSEGRGKKGLETSPNLNPVDTRVEVARIARVSDNTIAKVKVIEAKATPEQKAKLVAGDTTVNQVFVAIKREEVKQNIKQAEWPQDKYRVIYADPPWRYGNTMPEGTTQPDDHYPLLPLDDICALPVEQLALDDAVLFLWATSPILEDAFQVIHAWGFQYKASFVWDKVKHNMGHYNSVRHEFLLVAVRGSCQPDEAKLFDSVQTVERTGHSEKPEVFREIIQSLYPYGPRIELYGRKSVAGWDVYGNQVAPALSR